MLITRLMLERFDYALMPLFSLMMPARLRRQRVIIADYTRRAADISRTHVITLFILHYYAD